MIILLGAIALIVILLVASSFDFSFLSQVRGPSTQQGLPLPLVSISKVAGQIRENGEAMPNQIKAKGKAVGGEQITPIVEQTNAIGLPLVSKEKRKQAPWGVTFETVDTAGGLDIMAQAGARWIRRVLLWSQVEPEAGVRDWDAISGFDNDIMNARARDMEFIAVIEATPSWALRTGFQCGQVAPEYFGKLADFAYDAVKRYSVAPYNIQYWELWNEPDAAGVLGCWGDPGDTNYYGGAQYGEMLKVVYPRMKEANPNIEVLFGGLLLNCDPNNPPMNSTTGIVRSCVESNFLDGALSVGAGSSFDGVSFHAYDFYYEEKGIGWYSNLNWASSWDTTGPVSLVKANYIKELLSKYNVTDKYLVATEDALFCGPNRPDAPIYPVCISEEHERVKSYYLAQTFTIALAENWKATIWWSALGYRHSGLLNADLSAKPAYNSFQFVSSQLTSAEFVRTVMIDDNIMAYEFKRNNQIVWVLWAKTSESIIINLLQQPANIWVIGDDGNGIAILPSISISVGRAPIFVEY